MKEECITKKVWFISDTHGHHHRLDVPEVDMVIHCGDFCDDYNEYSNSVEKYAFLTWYEDLPIKTKILVPGNHDISVKNDPSFKETCRERGIHFLANKLATIEGLEIAGFPYTPKFGSGIWAYTYERGEKNWVLPESLDILVTHGPPYRVRDLGVDFHSEDIIPVGCPMLAKEVKLKKPKYHCFGHIHDNPSRGINNAGVSIGQTTFINCSVSKDHSKEINNGIVLTISV